MSIELGGYARYALYYAPPPASALAAIGSAWLGRNAETGESLGPPTFDGLPRPWPELVAAPTRYGLHGTLKAPFALAGGVSAADLDAALAAYAADRAAVSIGELRLGVDHGFVALRPVVQSETFAAAVFDVVTSFERFRAPLSAEDLARRRASGLTERQDASLLAYGYPYVGADFHFHLTLTGKLPAEEADRVAALLRSIFAPALEEPLLFDSLCLFGDPGGGAPFRLLRRRRFAGA